jgi:hypothetical protein
LHIYCWTSRRLASCTAGDDGVVEAGVRQKADHGDIAIAVGAARGSASLSDQRERDGRLAERILLALTSRDILVDLGPMPQVKGDGAVDLLQSQRRKR